MKKKTQVESRKYESQTHLKFYGPVESSIPSAVGGAGGAEPWPGPPPASAALSYHTRSCPPALGAARGCWCCSPVPGVRSSRALPSHHPQSHRGLSVETEKDPLLPNFSAPVNPLQPSPPTSPDRAQPQGGYERSQSLCPCLSTPQLPVHPVQAPCMLHCAYRTHQCAQCTLQCTQCALSVCPCMLQCTKHALPVCPVHGTAHPTCPVHAPVHSMCSVHAPVHLTCSPSMPSACSSAPNTPSQRAQCVLQCSQHPVYAPACPVCPPSVPSVCSSTPSTCCCAHRTPSKAPACPWPPRATCKLAGGSWESLAKAPTQVRRWPRHHDGPRTAHPEDSTARQQLIKAG